MENLKHTRGEWLTESTNVLTEQRLIANCTGNGAGVTEEDLANAKLIASAPDMLEACLKLVEWNKKYPPNKTYDWGKANQIEAELTEIVNQQINAINKATK